MWVDGCQGEGLCGGGDWMTAQCTARGAWRHRPIVWPESHDASTARGDSRPTGRFNRGTCCNLVGGGREGV